jgi:hypothetical protein
MTNANKLLRLEVAERATVVFWNTIRGRPRTVLASVALAVVTVGVAMNWSALVAAGIAPVLITALPCALMCGLGLCMSGLGKGSCPTERAQQQPTASASDSVKIGRIATQHSDVDQSAELPAPSDAQSLDIEEIQPQQERRPTHA